VKLSLCIPLAAAALVAAACSASSPASSDAPECGQVDDCLGAAETALTSCLPPADAVGVLSADRMSCTYATGQVIAFDAPVLLPVPSGGSGAPTFRLTTNGKPCVGYGREGTSSITEYSVTTAGGTTTQTLTSPGHIRCGSGSDVADMSGACAVDPTFSFSESSVDASSAQELAIDLHVKKSTSDSRSVRICTCRPGP
jgi:hypothetical protein